MLILLEFLKKLLTSGNGGSLLDVLGNVAPTTSTSSPPPLVLTVKRTKMTENALFGEAIIGNEFICYSMENRQHQIAPGTYSVQLDMSPHLGYKCPHVRVPGRDALAGGDAGIRLHVANYPAQLEGCIALGQALGPDCLEHSQAAFDNLMALLPQIFTLRVTSSF